MHKHSEGSRTSPSFAGVSWWLWRWQRAPLSQEACVATVHHSPLTSSQVWLQRELFYKNWDSPTKVWRLRDCHSAALFRAFFLLCETTGLMERGIPSGHFMTRQRTSAAWHGAHGTLQARWEGTQSHPWFQRDNWPGHTSYLAVLNKNMREAESRRCRTETTG